MKIEQKILKFFLLKKEKNIEYTSLVSLDRYLVHVTNEEEYLGTFLLNKVNEMVVNDLIKKNNQEKYSITQKGLEYLAEY